MDDNPYAPPSAELFTGEAGEAAYYAVGALKLSALSIATLGIYELYWSYQNWKRIRERERKRLSPFWRSVFAPLWAYPLFKQVERDAAKASVASQLVPGLLAALYFLLSMLWRLPDPWWLLSAFTFVFLIPVDGLAGRVNRVVTPDVPHRVAWSPANVVGVLVGALLFALMLLGTFLPEDL